VRRWPPSLIAGWTEPRRRCEQRPTRATSNCCTRTSSLPLGRKPLESLRPDDVQRLYADLLQKAVGGRNGRRVSLRSPAGVGGATLSPGTVHHVHVVLHIALEKAVKWGYVPRNVCDVVDAPRVQQREMHPPTAVDVAALLDAAGADPLLTLWTLAAYTGARPRRAPGAAMVGPRPRRRRTDHSADATADDPRRHPGLRAAEDGQEPAHHRPAGGSGRRPAAAPAAATCRPADPGQRLCRQ